MAITRSALALLIKSLWQPKRLGALNKFKARECNVLICTDVASRGLDIPSVDMVINYDVPSNSKVRSSSSVWIHTRIHLECHVLDLGSVCIEL